MKFLFFTLILCLVVIVKTHEFKGFTLKFLYQVFTGDFINSKRKEKVETKLNNQTSNYLDYLKYSDTRRCSLYEIYEAEKRDKRAKCIKAKGNGTLYLMTSLPEVMQLLSVAGSGTKAPENPGNCVVILFYTKFCPGCQALVPHWNSLARNFVDIKVGAIDALEHTGLNTDFGIIGLPSIVLFHQGRMIQKFNTTQPATVTNVINFIQTHTNLKPTHPNVVVTSDDFSPTSPLKVLMNEESFDGYLLLSWMFIITCAIYYFTKSRTYQQIVEMINRTWQEAQTRGVSQEAQLQ